MPEKSLNVTNTPLGKTNSAAWRQPQSKVRTSSEVLSGFREAGRPNEYPECDKYTKWKD